MKGIVQKLNLKGWIGDYVSYASQITDAPLEFHLGVGLTVLATACGSRVVYPGFGGATCWPNLYTLLIAPSGLYRKSTSLAIGERLLRCADPGLVMGQEYSREKFIGLLQQSPTSLLPISEFSSTLSIWSKDYMSGTKEMITDLYDNREDYSRNTLKEGKQTVHRPALNIIAASTIDWLREKLTEGDLRGGLMGRFLLIPGIEKLPDRGLNVAPDPELYKSLSHRLSRLSTAATAMANIKPMLPALNEWVKATEKKLEKDPNPDLVGFQSRIGTHALKIGVILQVSDDPGAVKYELSSDNLSKAFTLATWLVEMASEIAEYGFARGWTEKSIQRLIAMAGRNGGVEHQIALKNMHCSSKEFVTLVSTAVDRGQITRKTEKTEGRPRISYCIPEAKHE